MELIEEREYFEDAMAKHDFLKADIYMARMKEIAGEDVSTQRYIRRESAFLDYYLQRMTAEQLVAELEQLAEEVVPWYKQFLDSEVVYPFREQEITLLKRLAVAYGRIDEHPKSIKICEMLLCSLREGYMAEWEIEELSIVANLSKYYGAVGEYCKSMELCEYVLPKARKHAYAYVLYFILFDIEWNKIKMIETGELDQGELEGCKEHIKGIYYTCRAKNNQIDMRNIKNFYEEYFGEAIELSIL